MKVLAVTLAICAVAHAATTPIPFPSISNSSLAGLPQLPNNASLPLGSNGPANSSLPLNFTLPIVNNRPSRAVLVSKVNNASVPLPVQNNASTPLPVQSGSGGVGDNISVNRSSILEEDIPKEAPIQAKEGQFLVKAIY